MCRVLFKVDKSLIVLLIGISVFRNGVVHVCLKVNEIIEREEEEA